MSRQYINTIASIWGENMLGYLSLDIICSSKLTVFLEITLEKKSSLLGTDNVRNQIPGLISRHMEANVYLSEHALRLW